MPLDFPSNPIDGQISGNYVWSASSGAWKGKPTVGSVTIQSPTAPTNANPGDIWVNTNDGTAFSYFDDGTSRQWMEIISSGVPNLATKANLVGGNTITDTQAISATSSSQVPLSVRGAAGQTANIQEWKNSTGTNIAYVNNVGDIVGTTLISKRNDSIQEGGEIRLARASDNSDAWVIDSFGSSSTPDFRIFDNSGLVRLRIDGSGRVLLPYQPSFLATKSDNGNTYSGDYVFNISMHNTGGHYSTSTGRFTAPVAGRYFFITEIQTYGITAGTLSTISFKKNNAIFADSSGGTPKTIVNKAVDSSYHNTMVLAMVMDLAASDYVNVFTENSRGMQSHFSGYLIG